MYSGTQVIVSYDLSFMTSLDGVVVVCYVVRLRCCILLFIQVLVPVGWQTSRQVRYQIVFNVDFIFLLI